MTNKKKEKDTMQKNENDCTCGENCSCEQENCTCDDTCECDENCTCEDNKNYKILYLNEKQKSDEYLNLAKRYGADLENYKKRNVEIAIKEREEGIILAVEKFLPAIDALDRANTLVDDESSLKGLDLIKKQMLSNLENLGVKVIDSSTGLAFDPKFHNAIANTEDDKQKSGTIVEEYQKGYIFNGRIIRFSMVKVVK
ncbi:MAG: nucleotide exchange factor GrpE [Clostridia bacterium]|nr:nucleotide exchange factor GrpE [Clostridia bacterium]